MNFLHLLAKAICYFKWK